MEKKGYHDVIMRIYAGGTVEQFKWRSSDGIFHDVEHMATRHLFYTLRMIWNHSAKQQYRIRPYNKYTFSKFYTEKYLKRAVIAMVREVSYRTDLQGWQKDELRHMVNCVEMEALREIQ